MHVFYKIKNTGTPANTAEYILRLGAPSVDSFLLITEHVRLVCTHLKVKTIVGFVAYTHAHKCTLVLGHTYARTQTHTLGWLPLRRRRRVADRPEYRPTIFRIWLSLSQNFASKPVSPIRTTTVGRNRMLFSSSFFSPFVPFSFFFFSPNTRRVRRCYHCAESIVSARQFFVPI